MIASVSKQFTAVTLLLACMRQVVEQRRREIYSCLGRLQQPLQSFYKDVPAPMAGLTLHQLLTHTAGIPNPVRLAYAQGGFDALVALLHTPNSPLLSLDRPLDFTPGSQFAYSNSGYDLLTEVIAAVSKMSFAGL